MFWCCNRFPLLVAAITQAFVLVVQAQQVPTLNSIPPYHYDHNNITATNGNGTHFISGLGFRTNVCQRQRMVIDGQVELRHALKGLNMSVAITNYADVKSNEKYFFALSTNATIPQQDPGLFVVILDELAKRAGFEWRNTFAAIPPPTQSQSWSELLKWEVTHFDIAADYWAKSAQRMSQGISFPSGWYDGSIVMVSRQEPKDNPFDFWSFLVPFEWTVWWTMLGAIFATGLTYFFLERLNNAADYRHLEDKPWVNIFIAALTFTGHHEFKPNAVPSQLLTFSWGFLNVIVISAYTANMASFLVSKNAVETRITTIEDALLTATPLCVQRSSAMDDYLTEKYPNLNLVRKDTEQGMFEGLKLSWYNGEGGCGALLTNLGTFDIYQSQISINEDCSIRSDKRVLLNLPSGFATAVDSAIQCTSLISYVLDLHLQEMHQDGFIDAAWDQHISKVSTIQCGAMHHEASADGGTTTDTGFSLSLKDMGGIFLTHLFMSGVALLFAFYQRYYTKYREPEKKMRPINVDMPIKSVAQIRDNLDGSLSTVRESMDESYRSVKETVDGSIRTVRETVDGSIRTVRNLGRPKPTFRWSSSERKSISSGGNQQENARGFW